MEWDNRFLELAEHIAGWSKDPSTKVGAVAVDDKRQILALGYNGFPRRIEDSEIRLSFRELKYSLVVHAEMNCIYNATYSGVSLDGATVYVHGLPICHECAKGLIQTGVKRVVMKAILGQDRVKWQNSFSKSKVLFEEANVIVNFI